MLSKRILQYLNYLHFQDYALKNIYSNYKMFFSAVSQDKHLRLDLILSINYCSDYILNFVYSIFM